MLKYFIPKSFSKNPDLTFRSYALIWSSISYGVLLTIATSIRITINPLSPYLKWFVYLMAFTGLCIPWILKKYENLELCVHIFMCNLIMLISLSAYANGGLMVPATSLFAAVPLIAIFLGRQRMGFYYGTLSIGIVISLMLLSHYGMLKTLQFEDMDSLIKVKSVVLSLIIVYMYLIGLGFEKAQKRTEHLHKEIVSLYTIKTIASDINHQVNSPLTTIELSARQILKKSDPDQLDIEYIRKAAQTIIDSTGTISKLTKLFANYAEPSSSTEKDPPSV